jgi:manganese/zinc/iron transport system permease protein
VIVIAVFYKELKIASFDPMLAAVLGFSPSIIHYGLMTLVSLTAVGAFQAVGSVMVVAFMIGSPVTAYLLTDDLKIMLPLSAGLGALSGVLGYQCASVLDVSIAGSMAVMTGIIFTLVFIFAPKKGIVSELLRKKRLGREFAGYILLSHISNHENSPEEAKLNSPDKLLEHLHWDKRRLMTVAKPLLANGLLAATDGILALTDKGREEYSTKVPLPL